MSTYTPDQSPLPAPRSSGTNPLIYLGCAAAIGLFTLFFLGLAGGGVYYYVSTHQTASGSVMNSPKATTNTPTSLENVASWQFGQDRAQLTQDPSHSDIGWWTKLFYLPSHDAVQNYLSKLGLNITRIEPIHYQDTKDSTTLVYAIYALIPSQLLHLNEVNWKPTDPDLARFSSVLVLNQGLPPGQLWDTQNPTIAAEANTKLTFEWAVHYDKTFQTVTTDRPPFPDQIFTPVEVQSLGQESAIEINYLTQEVQAINDRIKAYHDAQLAQISPNPPKPELLSRKFGGDGSGEPTKSAERIGGGTAAGAAAGAGFGAIAGDAGIGAGAGAGAGLLGGIIYDAVSKSNDRKRHEREVDAANEERLDDWRAQVKALNAQRDAVNKQSTAMHDKLVADLLTKIANQKGRLGPNTETASTPLPDTAILPAEPMVKK